MGPTIILDKSTLQMLSLREIVILQKYYCVNLVPVLAIEILGDLKKEEKGLSRELRVKELTKKLFATTYFENVHYKDLILMSLRGRAIPMDGRVFIQQRKMVQTDDGQIGHYDDGNSHEMKALLRWRSGNFGTVDHELNEIWKSSISGINLDYLREVVAKAPIHSNIIKNITLPHHSDDITKLRILKRIVHDLLKRPEMCDLLLLEMFARYNIDKKTIIDAFNRKISKANRSILSLAPYAAHCLGIDFLFELALLFRISGPRPTNLVDLEYLYYLPFSNALSSNDRFLIKFGIVVCENQMFISGKDLKNDLKSMLNTKETLNNENQLRWDYTFQNEPPFNEKSITSILWVKHCRYSRHRCPEDLRDAPKIDPAKKELLQKGLVDFLKKQVQECKDKPGIHHNGKEDFFIMEKKIFLDDPCPCGSGKIFAECHGAKYKQ